jgi:ABC-type antimicrobial peptide transport system permease subunit
MYVPSLDASPLTIVVRTRGDEDQMVKTLRSVVASVDADQPVARAMTMSDVIGNSLAPARLTATLLSAFGAIALILAGSSIFGVMAFSVATRTRDIGIHMALGAKPHAVRTTVLRQGLWLALGGLALGVPSVFIANRVFGALFPVTISNLPMIGLTAVLLVATAAIGCYIPARRATRIDPIVALRQD